VVPANLLRGDQAEERSVRTELFVQESQLSTQMLDEGEILEEESSLQVKNNKTFCFISFKAFFSPLLP
jgi:hypothetical protein